MPRDCLGKIEARSGMNRLLLVITLGDFVNPGYKGHYPLQIINMSKFKIKVYPQMSVCQLLLSELSSIPDKRFDESSSSYYYDNGGPACWWDDRQIRLFMKENADLEKSNLEKIRLICNEKGLQEHYPAILSRYAEFYRKSKLRNENPEKSVDAFVQQEKKGQRRVTHRAKQLEMLQVPISSLAGIGTLLGIIYNVQRTNNNVSTKLIIAYIVIFVVGIILINSILVRWVHHLKQKKFLA